MSEKEEFAGRKDMEHEVRNVCVQNRVGVSLLDYVLNM